MPQVKLDLLDDATGQYLGSLDIDDHDTFPLAVTQSIADMKDITKRSGVVSKTFKVPASANNNRLLQYLYNSNVAANGAIWGKRAVVSVDGLPVFSGKIRVKYATQTNDPTEYDLELAGDNLDWALLMKNVSIRSLDFGNTSINSYTDLEGETSNIAAQASSQLYTKTIVEASWDKTYDDGWDYVYSLKSYGQRMNPDFVVLQDMRPDVYVRAVLDKAFAKTGYRFSSNFWDTAFAKRLVMLFTGNNFIISQPQDSEFKLSIAPQGMAIDTSTGVNDFPLQLLDSTTNGNYLNAKVRFDHATNELVFLQGITGSLQVTVGMSSFGVSAIRLKKNGVDITTNSIVQGNPFTFPAFDNLQFCTGDRLQIILAFANGTTTLLPSTTASFTANNVIVEGIDYRIGDVLPEMTCLDFVSGLVNLFNLYFRTDTQNKIVYCEPRPSFYQNISHAIDWTNKLDVGKGIQTDFIDSYNRTLRFRFAEDGNDSLAKKEQQRLSKIPGSVQYDLPLRYPQGYQDLGSKIFAYSMVATDTSLNTGNNHPSPSIPLLWSGTADNPDASYDFTPRILYYPGLVAQVDSSGSQAQWKWYNTLISNIPAANYGVSGSAYLSYSGTDGLVKQFYANDIATLVDGKVITAYFYLKPSDLLQLDLRTPIFINHHNIKGYYYLNKVIDYQPHKVGTTKVELVKAIDMAPDGINYGNHIPVISKLGIALNVGTGNTEHLNIPKGLNPSTVLQNGSNNWSLANSGSVVLGNGLQAAGVQQHIFGQFNQAHDTDVFQIGAGTSVNDRYNAIRLTKDGTLLVHGGNLYTTTGNQILFAAAKDAAGNTTRLDKVYLVGSLPVGRQGLEVEKL